MPFSSKSVRVEKMTNTTLRESGNVLTSRNHITVQLKDRLPTPPRDVNNTNKDHLILCYPSNTDPPIWILSFKSLGLLKPVQKVDRQNDAEIPRRRRLTPRNLLTALARRLEKLSRVIVL
jgi:hypothetical protein